jgi:hypothetical protein
MEALAVLPLQYQEKHAESENIAVTKALLEALVTVKWQKSDATVAKMNLNRE